MKGGFAGVAFNVEDWLFWAQDLAVEFGVGCRLLGFSKGFRQAFRRFGFFIQAFMGYLQFGRIYSLDYCQWE